MRRQSQLKHHHSPDEPSQDSAECRARSHEFSRSQITETDRNTTRLLRFFVRQNCRYKTAPVQLKYEEKKKNPLVQSHIARHTTPARAFLIESIVPITAHILPDHPL